MAGRRPSCHACGVCSSTFLTIQNILQTESNDTKRYPSARQRRRNTVSSSSAAVNTRPWGYEPLTLVPSESQKMTRYQVSRDHLDPT